jgi:phosphoglycolate phosphatase
MIEDAVPTSIRNVVFDFDGTLADSYAAITASVNHVRALHGLAPLGIDQVKQHVGHGPSYLIEHTVGADDIVADFERYRAHHPSVMAPLTHLLPGAAEALAAVQRTGRRAAICSNKPRPFTLELLQSLRIASLIDVVVGPEDAARPKPAPDMLLLALARLGADKDATLYVGDMTVDIQTARAAGVRVWIVPTGSDTRAALEQARPDRLLRDLMELAKLLEPLAN